MHITGIEVFHNRADERGARAARVAFLSETTRVHVECRDPMTGANRHSALIADALRQLRRMPEFRGEKGNLTFSPGVWSFEAA
jgi:hypothetical protein